MPIFQVGFCTYVAGMENKRAHLELLQGVINRMAGNSFVLKGWSVVLVSALFALAASGGNHFYAILALFPAAAFWVLDGYFLWQERLFRKLYDRVRLQDEDAIDFSMNTSVILSDVAGWLAVTFSNTLLIFHGAVVVTILIVIGGMACGA